MSPPRKRAVPDLRLGVGRAGEQGEGRGYGRGCDDPGPADDAH